MDYSGKTETPEFAFTKMGESTINGCPISNTDKRVVALDFPLESEKNWAKTLVTEEPSLQQTYKELQECVSGILHLEETNGDHLCAASFNKQSDLLKSKEKLTEELEQLSVRQHALSSAHHGQQFWFGREPWAEINRKDHLIDKLREQSWYLNDQLVRIEETLAKRDLDLKLLRVEVKQKESALDETEKVKHHSNMKLSKIREKSENRKTFEKCLHNQVDELQRSAKDVNSFISSKSEQLQTMSANFKHEEGVNGKINQTNIKDTSALQLRASRLTAEDADNQTLIKDLSKSVEQTVKNLYQKKLETRSLAKILVDLEEKIEVSKTVEQLAGGKVIDSYACFTSTSTPEQTECDLPLSHLDTLETVLKNNDILNETASHKALVERSRSSGKNRLYTYQPDEECIPSDVPSEQYPVDNVMSNNDISNIVESVNKSK